MGQGGFLCPVEGFEFRQPQARKEVRLDLCQVVGEGDDGEGAGAFEGEPLVADEARGRLAQLRHQCQLDLPEGYVGRRLVSN